MRARIRGKQYRVEFRRALPNSDGHACRLRKEIVVSPRLKGERKLEVIIHELLHICFWDLDESAIEESASDIARVLTRLGYRDSDLPPPS